MKILGVDISSKSTGWAILEGDKVIDFGKVNPTGKLSHANKLFLFAVELKRIIERCQPDEIAIEDVVQVKSVSVAKILARFNGVAIIEAYRHLQRDPTMFEPSEWKKQMDNCTGGSKKCEVQNAVCRKFGFLKADRIEYFQKRIDAARLTFKDSNEMSSSELKGLKKQLKKLERKEPDNKEQINDIKQQIESVSGSSTKNRKAKKKEMSEIFDKISMDIYTESMINEDVADAIGVAFAFQKVGANKCKNDE